jgi:hypothetical protein
VKSQTVRELLDAFRQELRAAGLPQPEDVARTAKSIENLEEQVLAMQPDEAVSQAYVANTYKIIEEILRKLPEPSPDGYRRLMSKMKQTRYLQRDWILELVKKMPHRPGGAPAKLTPQQKTRVCKLIGSLTGEGDTYAEAVEKVAKSFEVSTKTIQRAWQEARRTRKDHPKPK